MELGLVREIGSKALLAGGLTLLGYWIYNAVKLVLDARGINPLIKQFFTQVAAGRIDGGHPGPEQRPVAFTPTLHQIHPCVDHLVAKRAFGGDLGQRLEHRPRQNNFAAAALTHPRATAVEPRRAAHPPIAPAHRRQRLAPIHQRTAEMLPVEAVKQRQQRLQRHRTGGGDPNQRHLAVVSQTRPCFDSW